MEEVWKTWDQTTHLRDGTRCAANNAQDVRLQGRTSQKHVVILQYPHPDTSSSNRLCLELQFAGCTVEEMCHDVEVGARGEVEARDKALIGNKMRWVMDIWGEVGVSEDRIRGSEERITGSRHGRCCEW